MGDDADPGPDGGAPDVAGSRVAALHARHTTSWLGYQVAASVVLLDQATKRVAEAVLDRGVEVALLGSHIGWQLVYNPGGAYGISAPSWFFLIVTVVVTVIVVRNLPVAPGLRSATAYGLLLAGALGNALDRVFRGGFADDPSFFHGHVIDFVAINLGPLGSFPRFNVADISITFGFVLLVVDLWISDREEAARATARAPSAQDATEET